jgi:hypothetical protein
MLEAMASALESHILKKVGHTIWCIHLGTWASIHPHTRGCSLGMKMCLCRDSKTIWKGSDFSEQTQQGCCCQQPWKYLS